VTTDAVPEPTPEGPAADLAFLGLGLDPSGLGSFEVTVPLTRMDSRLYGGTAGAVATAAAEAVTGRRGLWTTVQFISHAELGDVIQVQVEVLAHGRRTSQARVTAVLGDRVVFAAVAATAEHKPGGLAGGYLQPPRVVPFDQSEPYRIPVPEGYRPAEPAGFERVLEIRTARPDGPKPPAGHLTFWARARGQLATPAVLAYLSDMIPLAVARAAGRAGAGTSLDNTLRFGPPTRTDWVLVALEPHLAVGGYGHGQATLWSPEGELLAVASQTASMILFD
jgi:acyl-CoA thioesterase